MSVRLVVCDVVWFGTLVTTLCVKLDGAALRLEDRNVTELVLAIALCKNCYIRASFEVELWTCPVQN